MRELSPNDAYDRWAEEMDDLFPERLEDEYEAFVAGFARGKEAGRASPLPYKKACRNGHPQTPENTYFLRTCRQCQIDRTTKWRKQRA